jgi:hypothetical protein
VIDRAIGSFDRDITAVFDSGLTTERSEGRSRRLRCRTDLALLRKYGTFNMPPPIDPRHCPNVP